MTRHDSPVKRKELLAEAQYNKVKADLAQEALDYYKEHGVHSWAREYKAAYQRRRLCLKRRAFLLKMAKGMA